MSSTSSIWSWLDARLERHRKTVIAVTLVIAAIPACFATLWVLRYGVDVPTKDDWDMAPVILKAHSGALRFSDLFEQQQEARTVLPRLIFILSASGEHWNVRNLMLLSVAFCAATALCVYRLLLRTGLRLGSAAFCFWIAALLIFSAPQFEVWLWASGFPSFMPALFLLVALNFLETKLSIGAKFALCALCAIASSFTLPHGLLLWGLTFPILLLGGTVGKWKRWLVAWILLTALCAAIYFHGYAKPSYLPEFAPAISLLDYVRYFLAFCGGEFAFAVSDHRGALTITLGAILIAILLASFVFAFVRRSDLVLWRRTLPWFAVGAYSIGSALLAMLGRVAYGIDSAVSSRYVTFSLYLTVAVVALAFLIAGKLWQSRRTTKLAAALCSLGIMFCAAFFTLYQWSSNHCVQFMEGNCARTRLLRSAVLLSQVLDTSAAIKQSSNPALDFIRSHAAALDDWKLLRPRLLRSADVSALATGISPGRMEELEPIDAERLRASGFALLGAKHRPADAVVLTYEMPNGGAMAFALSDEVTKRRDFTRQLQGRKYGYIGWSASFPRNAFPAGAKISAWALDAEIPKLYRLEQSWSP